MPPFCMCLSCSNPPGGGNAERASLQCYSCCKSQADGRLANRHSECTEFEFLLQQSHVDRKHDRLKPSLQHSLFLADVCCLCAI